MGVYHCTFHQLTFTAQKEMATKLENVEAFISLANM